MSGGNDVPTSAPTQVATLSSEQLQDALAEAQAQVDKVDHSIRLQELKDAGFNKGDSRQECVRQVVQSRYELVRVTGVGKEGEIYFSPLDEKGNVTQTYKRLTDIDANNIARSIYQELFKMAPADKVKSSIETIKLGVEREMDSVNNKTIKLAEGLYWDTDEARLADEPNDICMRELFDSRGTSELSIPLEELNPSTIRIMYKNTLRYLEQFNGELNPDASNTILDKESPALAPFWVWANEDKDTYNDLLKAVATNFMSNKPKGAFVLIGLKRNGKSTFLKMLHILFGRNNTSSVRLSDFNNHGLNGDLWTTMMNAPDEEDEGRGKDLLEAQGNFKSIAAHESLKLRQLYAQHGKWVNSDFMCFFPMNHFPEWKGNGAAACMHRTLPLFFNNDLSKYDNSGKDFVKETFTSGFYELLLGIVLAFATYYNNREMVFSKKMKKDKEKVAEEVDNISLYLECFTRWFDGYRSKKLLFEDYKLWCKSRDIRYQEYSVFSHTLEMRDPKPTSVVVGDRRISVHRIGARAKRHFYEEYQVPELKYMPIGDVITTDTDANRVERSVVEMLEEVREDKLKKYEPKDESTNMEFEW